MSKYSVILTALLVLLGVTALLALSIGRFYIPPQELIPILQWQHPDALQHNIIFNLRLPRVLGAIVIGAALAIAGISYLCCSRV